MINNVRVQFVPETLLRGLADQDGTIGTNEISFVVMPAGGE